MTAVMHRRTFVFATGTFAFLVSSYFVWTALACMRPVFIYSSAVPADAKAAISKWRKTSKMLDQGPILQCYLESLITPFEMKLRWMTVELDSSGRVLVDDPGIDGISFEKDSSGHWIGWHHSCSGTNPVF